MSARFAVLAALAVLAAAAASPAAAAAAGVAEEDGFEYKPATPLVYGAEGAAASGTAALADRMRFSEQRWTRPAKLAAQPVVPVNESEPMMPTNEQMAANRECPPPPCPRNGTCPHPGGHCCGASKHCCEKGWSCVKTDPPVCVKEKSLLVWAECVGRACKDGFKCPHEGVTECCMGGSLCCKKGYRCFGWDNLSMTCARMTAKQIAEMEFEERQNKKEVEQELAEAQQGKGIGVPVGF